MSFFEGGLPDPPQIQIVTEMTIVNFGYLWASAYLISEASAMLASESAMSVSDINKMY